MFTITEYIFCIDTDKYSGNFNRKLTAYCVGQIGECAVGQTEIDQYEEWLAEDATEEERVVGQKLNDYIVQQNSDDNCYRPCRILPTPGYSNNGNGVNTKLAEGEVKQYDAYQSVGILFGENEPTKDIVDFIVKRAKEYCSMNSINIIDVRLITEVTTISSTSYDIQLDAEL